VDDPDDADGWSGGHGSANLAAAQDKAFTRMRRRIPGSGGAEF
jgi:hypothetical protein